MIDYIQDYLAGIGEEYGVNPVIFGILYFGAMPFFTLSVAWLVRNIRRKKPVVLPLLSTGLFFTSAYIYLIFSGHNVPLWVYIAMAAMVGLGVYSTYQKIQSQLAEKTA